jgi:phage terminase small subunit
MLREGGGGPIKRNGLTARQEAFVTEYCADNSITRAAIRAGYSVSNADSIGYQLLQKPRIAAEIERRKALQFRRADLTAARILEELRRLACFDPRSCFTEAGNLKPLHLLTDEQASAIASFEVVKRNLTAGDGAVDTVYKVRFWDKTRALELLAKHFGLLVERLESHGEITIRWQTDEIRPAIDVTPSAADHANETPGT